MTDRPIRSLSGVGEKTEKLFQKLGITNTGDLLRYFPRTYESYGDPVQIANLKENEKAVILAGVASGIFMKNTGRLPVTTVTVADESGRLPILWFRAPYLRSILKKGSIFYFKGTVARKNGKLRMEHPKIFSREEYEKLKDTLQPVYPLTAGITGKTIARLVRTVLSEEGLQTEYLPPEIRERYALADSTFALETIHFPKDMDNLISARRRLVFDEFFLFILAVRQLKEKTETAQNSFPMQRSWLTEDVIEGLPYILTKAQRNAWNEIERDLCSHSLMARLVQGDVGSGKTILAFLAMILTADNGWQAALMAPTEVLAQQHFEDMKRLLSANGLEKYAPVLLTGSVSAKERREIYEKIRTGESRIIIGTHALIQDKVEYHSLALVVTDEQHRFGVKQREALSGRGRPPHILVMSATPIPRTLAIILYGDLDISVIDEMPASRLPIRNAVVDSSWREKAYAFITRQVQEGRQVYIICPMVDESEELDAENVTDYTERLKEALPEGITVASLHGRMKAKEKNSVMEAFSSGQISVLVSTTVIEVGVNVPNATVMMVENAERFGLAQLHQLRGRVGRGAHQSYCIFVQGGKDEETSKRLQILAKSNDGFYIAGQDLAMRGPGDLFGIRQSGDMQFGIGDIYQDADILKEAGEAAAEVLSLDPDISLAQHAGIAARLEKYRESDLQNLGL